MVPQKQIVTFVCVLLFGAHHVSEALDWTLESLQTTALVVCDAQDLHLDLQFTLHEGEIIQDKRWARDLPGGAHQVIALSVEGDFAVMPAFASRVTFNGNASITISGMTTADSGTYTVEVSATNPGAGGSFHHIEHAVNVTVIESPISTLTVFSVEMLPNAEFNQTTQSYHAVLRCYVESSVGLPQDVQAIWQTPTGSNVSSSRSDGGSTFYLQLENPVKEGTYMCRLHSESPSFKCLAEVQGYGEVKVDLLTARLTIMEAKQSDLEDSNAALTSQVNILQTTEDIIVHFHASFVSPTHLNQNEVLLFTNVPSNEGGGYNSTSGHFIVPVSGSYYFAFTTTAPNHLGALPQDNLEAYAYMVIDNSVAASARSKYQGYFSFSTAHTLRHLNAGQEVWIKSAQDNKDFDASYSSFTGFLFKADPPQPQPRRQQRNLHY